MTAGDDQQAATTAITRGMTPITRGLVQIYKEHFGHGPTWARSWFCEPEVIVCVMRGTLTTKERTMRDGGDAAGIHETRQTVDKVMEPEMRAVVEEALEREVEAVVSGLEVQTDVASHVFILQSGDG